MISAAMEYEEKKEFIQDFGKHGICQYRWIRREEMVSLHDDFAQCKVWSFLWYLYAA